MNALLEYFAAIHYLQLYLSGFFLIPFILHFIFAIKMKVYGQSVGHHIGNASIASYGNSKVSIYNVVTDFDTA